MADKLDEYVEKGIISQEEENIKKNTLEKKFQIKQRTKS